AYHLAGQILLSQGRYANAAERLQQAVKMEPESAEALNDWGRALTALGERDLALEKVQQALRLDPNLVAAHATLGQLFVELERWTDAVEPLSQTIKLEEQSGSRHSYRALAAQSDLSQALAKLRRYDEAADVTSSLVTGL